MSGAPEPIRRLASFHGERDALGRARLAASALPRNDCRQWVGYVAFVQCTRSAGERPIRSMYPPKIVATALCAWSVCASVATAQLPVRLEVCAFGPGNPTEVTAPLGDPRLFVNEQLGGRVRVIDAAGNLLTAPFLQLGPDFESGGERGLLGLTFHPAYATNGWFFVTYNDLAGRVVLSRFSVSPSDPNAADPTSEIVLLRLDQPFLVHKGGDLEFGLDGYLYMTTGDGGGSGDGTCRPQRLDSLLGKVLRLDVDTIDLEGTYSIPDDNPFVGVPGARGEIWHLGFRNPWRFCIDPLSGDMWIGDVGENTTEEIDWAGADEKGVNFGWKKMEGANCFVSPGCNGPAFLPCNHPSLRLPLIAYSHANGCAVIGGQVYRGSNVPALDGTYFYADFCSARVWAARAFEGQLVSNVEITAQLQSSGGFSGPVAIGRDGFGEIILATVGGCLFRFIPDPTVGTPIAPLSANTDQVSLSGGGTQSLTLDAGASNANGLYLVLGSLSGKHPGVIVENTILPLQIDAYTLYLLDLSIAPPLSPAIGLLDGQGRANAAFTVAPGATDPSFAGLTVHHAFVVFDLLLEPRFVSNAVAVELAP